MFPNCNPGKVHDVFGEVRGASSLAAHTFKAGASEALSDYPLIRYFLETMSMPRGLIPAEAASFLAVCRVLDLMDTIKKFGVGDRFPRELKQEVARSLRLHVAAYGCDWVKPKHHYMIHMPRQVEEDGVWLDCFVHERKHHIIKEAAAHIKNTIAYEKSVLVPVVNASLHLMERIVKSSLTWPHNICDELRAGLGKPCRLSLRMRFELMNLAKGDLLFVAESACIVSACVAYGFEFGLLVHPMVLLEKSSATTSRWQRLGDLQFLPLTKGVARHATSWFSKHDGTIVALGH